MIKIKQTPWTFFFARVGKKLASKLTSASASPLSFILRITPTIDDVTLQDKQFLHKLQNVNIQKAHCPDNISWKWSMHGLVTALPTSVEWVSESTSYCRKWKVFNVTTLFKSGVREDCGIYRPLAMLGIPRKITESVICESLDPHLRCVLQWNQY